MFKKFLITIFISQLFLSSSIMAQEGPTPVPTVASTPTPSGKSKSVLCPSVQSCIDSQVPPVISSCKAVDIKCSSPSTVFSLTASEVAQRAVIFAKCDRPNQRKNRSRCNSCYHRAKKPLTTRYKGEIFKGLLGQAVRIVEAERIAVCTAIGTKKNVPNNF